MAYNYNPYYTNYSNGATPDMLNQFKSPYQPMQMQQPMMQQAVQQPAQQPMSMSNSDMLWVLGEVEATSYPVAPNNTVTLWDKNQPTIYIKSANGQGVPSMRILDFTERTANVPKSPSEHVCKCGDKFVTKEAFNTLQDKYEEIRAIVEELKAKPVSNTAMNTEGE